MSKPGDGVVLRGVVALSACPQDLVPINGEALGPTEADFVVLDG